MGEEIALNKESIAGAVKNLREAAAGIQTRVEKPGGRSELETLERYRKDLERMSAVMDRYLELLEEDCGRIEQAASALVLFEGQMIVERLAGQ